MKRVLFIMAALITYNLSAQEVVNINNLRPEKDFDNIHVVQLSSDSLATSMIIWIKKGVDLHKHEYHTETLYILEGKGNMTLGDQTFSIKGGDFFNIPKNTLHSLVVTSEIVKVLSIQAPKFNGEDRIFLKKDAETLD